MPNNAPLTVLDHLKELQGRLFGVAIFFILSSAIVYPFFNNIVTFLLAPLQSDQNLVYLTPGGAFSFMISVCLYAGVVGALPVFIFHLYRFLMPAMKATHLRIALGYTIASSFLAIGGMAFIYYVTLPAALQFLTGFNIKHISAMLTIDAYMSFVSAYILAGAVLFQLPLIMLIINGVKPLKPGGLMKHQGKIILGSFIIAAIVSPTPDAINQTLLASPIVAMYQLGIVAVWIRNKSKHKKHLASNTQSIQPASNPLTLLDSPTSKNMPANLNKNRLVGDLVSTNNGIYTTYNSTNTQSLASSLQKTSASHTTTTRKISDIQVPKRFAQTTVPPARLAPSTRVLPQNNHIHKVLPPQRIVNIDGIIRPSGA